MCAPVCAHGCACVCVCLSVSVCACMCACVHGERERHTWPVFAGGCKLFFLHSDSESSERLLFLLPKQNFSGSDYVLSGHLLFGFIFSTSGPKRH